MPSTTEVVAATRRLAGEGLPTEVEGGTTCCYAVQDKVCVTGPGGERWEVYTILADAGAELEGKTLAQVGAQPAAATSATSSPAGGSPAAPAEPAGREPANAASRPRREEGEEVRDMDCCGTVCQELDCTSGCC